jgi:hypothetical protein
MAETERRFGTEVGVLLLEEVYGLWQQCQVIKDKLHKSGDGRVFPGRKDACLPVRAFSDGNGDVFGSPHEAPCSVERGLGRSGSCGLAPNEDCAPGVGNYLQSGMGRELAGGRCGEEAGWN